MRLSDKLTLIMFGAQFNMASGSIAGPFSIGISGSTTPALNLINNSDTTNGGDLLASKTRGTSASPTAVAANDRLGVFLARGWNSNGAFSGNAAAFGMYAAEAFTSIANGTYLRFDCTAVGATGRAERMRMTETGLGYGTTAPTCGFDNAGDKIRVRTSKTPASASATGNAGDICWDSSFVYVCVATDTWKRAAISTW